MGISWLDDIQQFYRERSTIEKEYASKLNGLAKKYVDKKGRKSSVLSVGEHPTVTPGSLEWYAWTKTHYPYFQNNLHLIVKTKKFG